MGVGQLNTTVLFKTNTPTTLGAGSVDNYTDLLTTKGEFKKMNGNRVISFGEIVEENRYMLRVRYDTDLDAGLRINGKVVIDGRWFTIASMELVEGKKRYYQLFLNEQING
jgi:SPP1 family predicted phage head-tail adaptor